MRCHQLVVQAPIGLCTLVLVLGLTPTEAFGQQLAYQWDDGQKFSYTVEIVVDTDSEAITYRGMTNYTVESSNETQSVLSYRGGLSESKRTKQRSTRRGSRGFPGFGGPPGFGGLPSFGGPRGFGGPPGPFSRPNFAGKTMTSNRITLSTRGEVLALEGDSQLPYLLGNVSLLPFEPLPKPGKRTWKYDSGISITEKNESDQSFGPFGPRGRFGPFGQQESQNVQAAGEGGNYKIRGTENSLVTVAKTYYLNTPKTKDNNVFKMEGEGTWTFDSRDHVPHACDMKLTLTIASGNSTTAIPITIKYSRLSPAALAEMAAKAKQRAAEAAKLAAEKKAMAETPLTSAEKSQALSALNSGAAATQIDTLNQLAEKSLIDTDLKIATAIESLLQHPDAKVVTAADKALRQWSSIYVARKKLEKAYQGPSPVKSTGLAVESTTPLIVGQLVQAQRPQRGSLWRAARVKELLPDGQVKLAFLTWGKENERDNVAVPRRSIQLAPPELEQPKLELPEQQSPPTPTPAGEKTRTWSDTTGRFKIDAVFVELVDGKVRLRRADGRMIAPLPLDKLSEADQLYIEQKLAAENPFKLE
ncbi:MAG: SHD1 domain-containing protein [Rubripirellula sp.]|nr:SHD1 domain-containing protein [Rubripirellula sp.]